MENKRILLVEDDSLLAGLFSKYLTDCGYRVDVTDNLETACELEKENEYDGLVFDGDFHYTPEDKIRKTVRNNAVVDFLGHMVIKDKRDVPMVIMSGGENYSWVDGFVNACYVPKNEGAKAILAGLESLLGKS